MLTYAHEKKTLLTLISNRYVVIYYPFHEEKSTNFGIAYTHINADPARRARALGSQSRVGQLGVKVKFR